MDKTKEVRASGNRGDPSGYRRLTAVDGGGYTVSKAEIKDVLFRIPFNCYFRT